MAYPFRAILSPIQFDDPSLLGLGFAKSIAQDSGATLHLLHVVPMVSAIGEPAVSAAMHSREEDKAIEELKKITDKHLKGLKCELHTRFAQGPREGDQPSGGGGRRGSDRAQDPRPPRLRAYGPGERRGGGGAFGTLRGADAHADGSAEGRASQDGAARRRGELRVHARSQRATGCGQWTSTFCIAARCSKRVDPSSRESRRSVGMNAGTGKVFPKFTTDLIV